MSGEEDYGGRCDRERGREIVEEGPEYESGTGTKERGFSSSLVFSEGVRGWSWVRCTMEGKTRTPTSRTWGRVPVGDGSTDPE